MHNLDDDLDVDISDLALFVPEWLWIACWKQSQLNRFDGMMMAMAGGTRVRRYNAMIQGLAAAA